MTLPLFRPEVLEARRQTWLGDISLAQPIPVWLLASLTVTAAVLVAGFLALGEYTRRSRVVGQLVPDAGLATVVAPVAGTIARLLPQEGESVERDEALAIIATSHATAANGDTTEGLLASLERRRGASLARFQAEQRLHAAEIRGGKAELAAARRELEQIETSILLEEERLRIADELESHFRALADQHYVSKLNLAQQEQAALDQEATLQALRRQQTALQREIAGIERRLGEIVLEEEARKAARASELAELDQERLQIEAAGEVLVEAPLDGLVASAIVESGQAVRSGQALLSIVPSGSVLQAQLLVPSRAVGFIESGDTVLLRYQAFPHEKFGHHRGTVLRVSRNALDPDTVAALTGSAASAEPFYRVIVQLPEQSMRAYGRGEALRPGMVLEADILGERR
ncbi:MAG TPA: HlyD family efflux transporter periplasmic adaptor subunit, partial [Woeseiaceae bacterium]|nr:HlyD family efflux transporter periplasmic adaptor subunit [Woeseiaceae bacterium]